MEKLVPVLLVFLAFHFLKAASQEFTYWWNIDCGSEQRRVDYNRSMWLPDIWSITTGLNKQVPQKQPIEEMNTLRFFPNGSREQSCYLVELTPYFTSYIVRAGFYYGNYDGLSRPPTFDLTINGKNWTTVNTTSSMGGGPIYHETIYVYHEYGMKVCLVQTREGEVPFISSMEFMEIENPLYTQMVPLPLTSDNDPNAAFHLVTRTNFGGPEVRFAMDNYSDSYNRIWTSGSTPKGCENISTLPQLIEPLENAPPAAVLADSIASINASDPIILTIDLPPLDGPHPAYFIFYFSNPAPQSPVSGIIGTRATHIYINGQLKSNITFEWGKSRVVTIDPVDVMGPTINITLAPDPDSNLPTMISGLEVFTRHYVKYEAPDPPRVRIVPNFGPPPSAATPLLLISVYIILAHVLLVVVL
ncbi:uncharacterized protein At1g24485-like [Vitis riparia]|uniref:uncharacterized protein At1g24485-like n=1 Tax=Vitis riparia TaxID=96939 RepID=UPI00155A79BB|nr:uncharacterized protein At1g24485-like [Vitis riparia]